jgi:hypothetical protein
MKAVTISRLASFCWGQKPTNEFGIDDVRNAVVVFEVFGILE